MSETEEKKVEETNDVPNDVDAVVQPEPAGFLDENPGEKSAMRLMALIVVVGGIVLCLVASIASLRGNTNTGTTIQLATTLLSFGFGGKLLQKFGEK